jgi:TRAP-type C4-dicarboxylate transport system substrate-binding protein
VLDHAAKEVESAEYYLDAKWSENAKKELIKNGVQFYTPTAEEKELWAKPAREIWDMFKDKINQDVLHAISLAQRGDQEKTANERLLEIAEKGRAGQ